jgi:predicted phage baseplate assembly protein
MALRILANATEAEQCAPLCESWILANDTVASGSPPPPDQVAEVQVEFDAAGKVTRLAFGPAAGDTLAIKVPSYHAAAAGQPGTLVVEALRLGTAMGAPNQLYKLPGPQLLAGEFSIQTLEPSKPRKWRQRNSLLASGPADCDFVLDAAEATVRFGDGRNGRAPPAGAIIIAGAMATGGSTGNAAAGSVSAIDGGLHNRALLADPAAFATQFERIGNPDAASGGADKEALAHAEGRAARLLQDPSRAVTPEDCELLALQTPGTAIARAAARANHVAGLPCYAAPGIITVMVVPFLPPGRPMPSSGLLAAVNAYLHRRHVIGSRIDVTGPDYLEINVAASIKAFPGQNKTALRDAVVAVLRRFLDPLLGGPDGSGWPLGRDVYQAEILQVIAAVQGVDHVLSLALSPPGSGPQCGNVCLPALTLTVSGQHQIEVN